MQYFHRETGLASGIVGLAFFGMLLVGESLTAQEFSIDQVRMAWKSTIDQYESVSVEWTEKRTYATGALAKQTSSGKPFPESDLVVDYQYGVRLKSPSLFRYSRSGPIWYSEKETFVNRQYEAAQDGNDSRAFYGDVSDDDRFYPNGFLSNVPADWDNYHVLPLLLFFRPLNEVFCPFMEQPYEIAGEPVFIDGESCVALRPVAESTNTVNYIYYVDPEKQFAVRRMTKYWGSKSLWATEISYETRQGRFVPVSWQTQVFTPEKNRVDEQHDSIVTAYRFETLAVDDFRFEFPVGSLVTDRSGESRKPVVFINRGAGERRIVTSEERRSGIRYKDYLNTDSGEAVVRVKPRLSYTRYMLAGIVLLSLIAGVFLIRMRSGSK